MRNSNFTGNDDTRKIEKLRGKSAACSITETTRRKNMADRGRCYLQVRTESKHASGFGEWWRQKPNYPVKNDGKMKWRQKTQATPVWEAS